MAEDFYRYQHDRLGGLLAWGVGSTLAGLLALRAGDPLQRGFAMQAAAWGAIDAAIALWGRRGAAQAATRATSGAATAADTARAAAGFRRILWINAGLDVGYVLAALAVLRWAGPRRDRQGLGWGILVQGLFLLVYDSSLAMEIGRRDV